MEAGNLVTTAQSCASTSRRMAGTIVLVEAPKQKDDQQDQQYSSEADTRAAAVSPATMAVVSPATT
jgi:hypothetical protein